MFFLLFGLSGCCRHFLWFLPFFESRANSSHYEMCSLSEGGLSPIVGRPFVAHYCVDPPSCLIFCVVFLFNFSLSPDCLASLAFTFRCTLVLCCGCSRVYATIDSLPQAIFPSRSLRHPPKVSYPFLERSIMTTQVRLCSALKPQKFLPPHPLPPNPATPRPTLVIFIFPSLLV